MQNRSHTWRPVWPFELPLDNLGAHLDDLGGSIPKAFKGNSADIVKTSIFCLFFEVGGGLGSSVELQMVTLRGSGEQLGSIFRTVGYVFCASNFAVGFWSATVTVWRGQWGGVGGTG